MSFQQGEIQLSASLGVSGIASRVGLLVHIFQFYVQ
jgi:hypothetical protein